jgi:hypothetical protein
MFPGEKPDDRRPKEMLAAALPVVNIYAEPSLEAEVTSQALYGAEVEVLAEAEPWVRVRTFDGYEGFTLRTGLCPWTARQGSHVAHVTQLSANVYGDAEVKSRAPLLNLPFESRLEVTSLQGSGERERWLPVRLLDSTAAFVQRGDVEFERKPCSLEQMLAFAHRFLGITYTWGGTSSYGYDCSGFVQMLFRQAGVSIPRDAQAQADWAGFQPVALEQLQPADVLFFGDSPREITHVGLYLGHAHFIHDTTDIHPCIQISRLDAAPWNERITAQRRLRR